MEITPKPTISLELDWSKSRYLKRRRDLRRKIPKSDKRTYAVMHKFRLKQKKLLDDEDPNPYMPTFVFYCFHGKLEN